MEAELRSLDTPFGESLGEVYPHSDNFCIMVRAEIGAKGRTGSEAFEFEVCSPDWLISELERYAVLPGGKRLFMPTFSSDAVEQYVRKRLLHATGETWEEVARKINEWARWECAE